jgi:hypothetical protein
MGQVGWMTIRDVAADASLGMGVARAFLDPERLMAASGQNGSKQHDSLGREDLMIESEGQ